jgi:hypothetical protein
MFHEYVTDNWREGVSHCHAFFFLVEFILKLEVCGFSVGPVVPAHLQLAKVSVLGRRNPY